MKKIKRQENYVLLQQAQPSITTFRGVHEYKGEVTDGKWVSVSLASGICAELKTEPTSAKWKCKAQMKGSATTNFA